MARDALSTARFLLRRRKFYQAITLLEGREAFYEHNFEYALLLGTACLYAGDIGAAHRNFEAARKIKVSDSRLVLAQAALFLRRGESDRALQYYLTVVESDPSNKTAQAALEFIRAHGDYDTICRWADTGKLVRFYPPLGRHPLVVGAGLFFVLVIAGAVVSALYFRHERSSGTGPRADLSAIALTADEMRHAQETDVTGRSYRYILSDREITASFERARRSFQNYRDNAARIDINRILGSNAQASVKRKAELLQSYLSEPTFDTLTDNPDYGAVAADPLLYAGVWVSWSGRISNVRQDDDGWSGDFLVGYETMQNVDGIVTVHFAVAPDIAVERALTVLAYVVATDGRFSLEGRAVYQSVQDVFTAVH
ncbi:MAG: hypothetical protein IJ191_03835 [Treponema sp.]|nr:hypothetical protein [Treponema sp.]